MKRNSLLSSTDAWEAADEAYFKGSVTLSERVMVTAIVDELSERAKCKMKEIDDGLADMEAFKARIKMDYEELQDILKCAEDMVRLVSRGRSR